MESAETPSNAVMGKNEKKKKKKDLDGGTLNSACGRAQ